jgi:hypothetical protein
MKIEISPDCLMVIRFALDNAESGINKARYEIESQIQAQVEEQKKKLEARKESKP